MSKFGLRKLFALVAVAGIGLALVARPVRTMVASAHDLNSPWSLFAHAVADPWYPVVWTLGCERLWPWEEEFRVHAERFRVIEGSGMFTYRTTPDWLFAVSAFGHALGGGLLFAAAAVAVILLLVVYQLLGGPAPAGKGKSKD